MALQINGILFDELTADPGSPVEGQVWFNSTTFQLKLYRNGSSQVIIDKVAFDAHALSTSNPHTTTLEQARVAGDTLAGVINMGGFKISNLGAGTLGTDAAQRAWVSDQITQRLAGLDWQESVISRSTTPPGSPITGDRYLIIATATGAWVGQENKITQYNGATWDFFTPNEGWTTRVEAENLIYTYDGTTWGNLGGAVSHSALLNLTADDHLQYLPRSGVRPMTGDLDMGAQSITNVNLVDGVDVPAHETRHRPGGADAIATGTPVGITDSTNAVGTGTTLARNDHQHAHGTRGGGTLHALTTSTGAGFYPQSNRAATTNPTATDDNTTGYAIGSRWLNTTSDEEFVALDVSTGAAVWKSTTQPAGAFLVHKAGQVAVGSFAGNPKKATVTFSTAFADASYGVTVTARTQNDKTFSPVVESQIAASFVINMGANNVTDLLGVNWVAVKNGESVSA